METEIESRWLDNPRNYILEIYNITEYSSRYYLGIFIHTNDKSYDIEFFRSGIIRGAKINGEVALVIRSPHFCPSVIYGETEEENEKRRWEGGLSFEEAAEFEKEYFKHNTDYCGSALYGT